MKKYDIFISYRRVASESAQLIASNLKAAGYNVFIDVESLRSGKFNEQLYYVIDNCRDFVLVLPDGALDRCSDPEDWVRLEVERAMAMKKNIIPIMLSGFAWPKPMPTGLESLQNYQSITASSSEFFDLSMKRLCGYLKSRSHAKSKRIVKWTGGIIAVLLLLALFSSTIIRSLSIPLYTDVSDKLTMQTSVMSLLGDSSDAIERAWSDFMEEYRHPTKTKLKEDTYSKLEGAIQRELSTLPVLKEQLQTTIITLTPTQVFQLGLRNISAEEVEITLPFCKTFFDDINQEANLIKEAINDRKIDLNEEKQIKESFQIFQINLNAYYYGYLSILALMPEKALGKYRSLVSGWRHFPNGVGLNHTEQEYEDFINREYSVLRDLNYDLSKRVLAIQQEVNDETDRYQEAIKPLVSLYDELLKDASPSPSANPIEDWTKIVMVASFIPDIIDLEKDGEDIPVPIELSKVKNDVSRLLADFSAAHPEFSVVADCAGRYYQKLSVGDSWQGLIVVDVSGEDASKVFPGSVVTKINNIPTSSAQMDALMDIIAESKIESMTILLPNNDGSWTAKEVSIDNAKTDISFLPLVP